MSCWTVMVRRDHQLLSSGTLWVNILNRRVSWRRRKSCRITACHVMSCHACFCNHEQGIVRCACTVHVFALRTALDFLRNGPGKIQVSDSDGLCSVPDQVCTQTIYVKDWRLASTLLEEEYPWGQKIFKPTDLINNQIFVNNVYLFKSHRLHVSVR
jgi:hypothetical protein